MNGSGAAHGVSRGGGAPTCLLLIRHARAAQPGDLRLPGLDLALDAHGEAEAQSLADRLRDFAPVLVSSSDARRTRQTGEIVAAACRIPLRVNPALREMDFGSWGGRTVADVVAAEPAAGAWFAHPDTGAPPGGERVPDAAARVLGALQALAVDHTGPVVVVGHAGSLRLAVAQAIGMPLSSYWRLRLDCASLSVATWTADGLVVERWNDTAHLEPLPNVPGTSDALLLEHPSAGAMNAGARRERKDARP